MLTIILENRTNRLCLLILTIRVCIQICLEGGEVTIGSKDGNVHRYAVRGEKIDGEGERKNMW